MINAWQARVYAQTGSTRKRIIVSGMRFYLMYALTVLLGNSVAYGIYQVHNVIRGHSSGFRDDWPSWVMLAAFGVVLPIAAGLIGLMPALKNIWNVGFFCVICSSLFAIVLSVYAYVSFSGSFGAHLWRPLTSSILSEVVLCAALLTLFVFVIRNNPKPHFHSWHWAWIAALPGAWALGKLLVQTYNPGVIFGSFHLWSGVMFAVLGLLAAFVISFMDVRVAIAYTFLIGFDALQRLFINTFYATYFEAFAIAVTSVAIIAAAAGLIAIMTELGHRRLRRLDTA